MDALQLLHLKKLCYLTKYELSGLKYIIKTKYFAFKTVTNSNQSTVTYPLKCLSIGTPKTINFPFVPNGKLIDFRCPNI